MRLNIGAHMSIAGGIDRAPARGHEVGCEALQVFTKSNLQWRAKPLSDVEAARFRQACREFDLAPAVGHACYLLNLGTSDEALWRRSLDSLVDELGRAERLGLRCLILHPGAHRGAGVEAGIARVREGLRETLRRTAGGHCAIALEATAGAGSVLGGRFEELAAMLKGARPRRRVGVCLDTAHLFAAGYDLRSPRGFQATISEFDRLVGLDRLMAWHLNDSYGALGTHVDHHQLIGHGTLGRAPFRRIMQEPAFRPLPKILETPKGTHKGREWDAISLDLLRRLAR